MTTATPSPIARQPSPDTLRTSESRERYRKVRGERQKAVEVVEGIVPAMAATIEQQKLATRRRAELERRESFTRSVLVVEDREDVRRLIEVTLARATLGVPVYFARNGAEARSLWYEHRPAVALVDLFLGPEQGDVVLRAFPRGVRAILTSGIGDLMTLRQLARGVNAVAMQKPWRNLAQVVRSLLDDISTPYWCHTDVETDAFVTVSPELSDLLGYSSAYLIGRPWREFVVPEDLPRCEAALRRNLAEGTGIVDLVSRMRCLDGSTVTFTWDCSPVTDGYFYCLARTVAE